MTKVGQPQASDPFDRSGIGRDSRGIQYFEGVPRTLTEVLTLSVERYADQVAVIDDTKASLTYAELWDKSCAIAGGLQGAGLVPGDRVCVDLPNSWEFVVTFLGTVLAGGVAVPIDQRVSASQRQAMIRDADARVLVYDPTSLPNARSSVRQSAPDDLAQLLYTSGTTGEPKGVMATQQNLAILGEITRKVLLSGRRSADSPLRNLVVIPLCHAAGCNGQLLPTLALGGTLVIARSSRPDDFLGAVLRHSVDTVLAVPAIYSLLVQRTPARLAQLTSLRRLVYGAAPVTRSLVEDLRRILPWVHLGNAYGMTEISNLSLFLPNDLVLSHHDSVGFAVPTNEARIDHPNDAECGELYLRGPNMAKGYWHRPDRTAETFGTGWVRTGDIAEIDAQGLVYIRDRVKDVINRGGEKVFSLEVEQAILSHPGVDEAAVLAVPDDVMGEKVGAIVVQLPGLAVSDAEMRDYLASRLPKQFVPEHFLIREAPLPRGPSGKILKEKLRQELGWVRA